MGSFCVIRILFYAAVYAAFVAGKVCCWLSLINSRNNGLSYTVVCYAVWVRRATTSIINLQSHYMLASFCYFLTFALHKYDIPNPNLTVTLIYFKNHQPSAQREVPPAELARMMSQFACGYQKICWMVSFSRLQRVSLAKTDYNYGS